ncbi:PQQ-dependent sugar dehydrogenase [Streptomyces sodiiphilus]|uniref:PQQ-dependent sugar dehydrogenase n=1 Tax=Streptomyces sodiiphilus TaxID=226217 RepID=A0ABN2PTZ8_9ACTN
MAAGRTRIHRTAAATLLAAVLASCAWGPAADRAGDQPPPPPDQGNGDIPGPGPTGDGGPGDGGTPEPDPTHTVPDPEPPPAEGSVKVEEIVAENLNSPWGLARLPDGDLLVGSRDTGTIHRVDHTTGTLTEVGTVPGVESGGEGGLLGLAVDSGYIYAYYTTASDNGVSRFVYQEARPEGNQLSAADHVLTGIPRGLVNNGGAIGFGPDGMLYIGSGDAGEPNAAQDPESLAGKVLRLEPNGRTPDEGNLASASPVYSLGHRNVVGLAWDTTGRLWAAETGTESSGELNLLDSGGDYGWPTAAFRSIDPVVMWDAAQNSPGGLAYTDGSLWVTALRGEGLWRVPMDGAEPLAEPELFLAEEFGSLRQVVPTNDGGLWVLTGNTGGPGSPGAGDDRLLRLAVH